MADVPDVPPVSPPAEDKLTPFLGPLAKLAGSQKFTVLVLVELVLVGLAYFGKIPSGDATKLGVAIAAAWKLAHGIQERKPTEAP